MPDGEVTIGRECEHEVAAIGRDTRERDASSFDTRIIQCIDFGGKGGRIGIEAYSAQRITHVLIGIGHIDSVGRTEIQCLAIGREGREGLESRIILQLLAREYLVSLHVIDHYIRLKVEYLYPITVGTVSCLLGAVGRESYISARWMPIGIDKW